MICMENCDETFASNEHTVLECVGYIEWFAYPIFDSVPKSQLAGDFNANHGSSLIGSVLMSNHLKSTYLVGALTYLI